MGERVDEAHHNARAGVAAAKHAMVEAQVQMERAQDQEQVTGLVAELSHLEYENQELAEAHYIDTLTTMDGDDVETVHPLNFLDSDHETIETRAVMQAKWPSNEGTGGSLAGWRKFRVREGSDLIDLDKVRAHRNTILNTDSPNPSTDQENP